ncbi:MAG: hypothetical protein KDK38_12905, partial [Leptospiraceae bacterium]|nr:hypothetical protein [Leptospiraceae bacterium]
MAGRKKKEQLDTATPQPSSKLDGHMHFDRDNDEISDEIFEAVESDSAELSEAYLKQLHVDELLEILDFIDEDE